MQTEQAIRPLLLERLAELEALIEQASEASATVMLDQQSVGRLSRMDAMQQQAMGQEQLRRRKLDCARIKAALARLDDGEYGLCLSCDEEIAANRLRIDPAATLCVRCAQL